MWSLFTRDFWTKPRAQLAPEGFYKNVPQVVGDNNLNNVFETTAGPPRMDFAGGPAQTGYPVPTSPGPSTFAMDYPGTFGTGFPPGTEPDLFEVGMTVRGAGPLYLSEDSDPEAQLV